MFRAQHALLACSAGHGAAKGRVPSRTCTTSVFRVPAASACNHCHSRKVDCPAPCEHAPNEVDRPAALGCLDARGLWLDVGVYKVGTLPAASFEEGRTPGWKAELVAQCRFSASASSALLQSCKAYQTLPAGKRCTTRRQGHGSSVLPAALRSASMHQAACLTQARQN